MHVAVNQKACNQICAGKSKNEKRQYCITNWPICPNLKHLAWLSIFSLFPDVSMYSTWMNTLLFIQSKINHKISSHFYKPEMILYLCRSTLARSWHTHRESCIKWACSNVIVMLFTIVFWGETLSYCQVLWIDFASCFDHVICFTTACQSLVCFILSCPVCSHACILFPSSHSSMSISSQCCSLLSSGSGEPQIHSLLTADPLSILTLLFLAHLFESYPTRSCQRCVVSPDSRQSLLSVPLPTGVWQNSILHLLQLRGGHDASSWASICAPICIKT